MPWIYLQKGILSKLNYVKLIEKEVIILSHKTQLARKEQKFMTS